jgi:hypothetical protein
MQNFTLAHKQALEALVEGGAQVASVVYDPTVVIGTPEADALAAGWVQYYREAAANLIEVIYTK